MGFYCTNVSSPSLFSLSRIDERNHDISDSGGGFEAFMVMGKSARMNECPASQIVEHTAVVA